MLILTQGKSELLNLDHITRIKRAGGEIIAVDRNRETTVLGEYATADKADQILGEIAQLYAQYIRGDGGPLATMEAYVQPIMFEPPKVYSMPEN